METSISQSQSGTTDQIHSAGRTAATSIIGILICLIILIIGIGIGYLVVSASSNNNMLQLIVSSTKK